MEQHAHLTDEESATDARSRLIDATIAAIDRGGEASVRVTEIAAAAGLSKSSIYYFFGDREGLVSAAEAQRYSTTIVGFDQAWAMLEAGPTREEWAEFVVRLHTSFGDADGARRRRDRIEILGSAVSDARLRSVIAEANRNWIAGLTEVIGRAQQLGLMGTAHSATETATWMHTLMTGRFQIEILEDPDRLRDWDAVTDTVIRTLCA